MQKKKKNINRNPHCRFIFFFFASSSPPAPPFFFFCFLIKALITHLSFRTYSGLLIAIPLLLLFFFFPFFVRDLFCPPFFGACELCFWGEKEEGPTGMGSGWYPARQPNGTKNVPPPHTLLCWHQFFHLPFPPALPDDLSSRNPYFAQSISVLPSWRSTHEVAIRLFFPPPSLFQCFSE